MHIYVFILSYSMTSRMQCEPKTLFN